MNDKVKFREAPRPIHVIIAIPTRGMMGNGFVYDLVNLVGFSVSTMAGRGLDIGLLLLDGTYVDQSRCSLVQTALENPATTHVLFLDDDMRFPRTALLQLLARKKPVVGANYCSRNPPPRPLAVKMGAELLTTGPMSEGLELVDGIPLGCTLIERRVFEAVEYPWFEQGYAREHKRWIGEDLEFCGRCAAKGIAIHVDHDLSKEIGHTGKYDFHLWDTNEWQAAPQPVPTGVTNGPILVPE